MSRFAMQILLLVAVAIAVAACGSQTSPSAASDPPSTQAVAQSSPGSLPRSHPQAVQPAAGVQASSSVGGGGEIVGDVSAHAPPLSQVKHELQQLNLCGGAVTAAEATPIVKSSAPGFVADPGTIQDVGQLPELTAQLNALGQALSVTIYGISGYRTPAHSVAVGGYADDPHTKGEAEDIGVNSLLRSSAAQISEPELARFGLYRPFDPTDDPHNTEVNHIQLIPHSGPLTLAQSTATFDPDPACK
jgi:Peptidase M15